VTRTRPQAQPSSQSSSQARLVLFGLGFLAFLLLGLVQAGYGPAFPTLGREYQLPASVVGLVASLHFAGTAIGTLLLGALLTRLSLRSSLMVAGLILLAGLLGAALSPVWWLLLAAASFGGLGYGMLSAGFNVAFAELGQGPSNLVNGMFGVGSVLSPVLVTFLAQSSHRPPFLLMAGLAALVALGVRLLWPKPAIHEAAGPAGESEPDVPLPTDLRGPAKVSRSVFTLFALCFFLYVGIEAGLGTWTTTYFIRLGAAQPALLTSYYWLALTAGRFVFAAVGSRVTPLQTLIFATCGAIIGGAVMLLGGLALAPAGLVLMGFCVAPVFSTLLAWFAQVQPPRLASFMLTAGSAGGAVLPAVTGFLLPRLGAPSIPLVPLVIAALLLAAALRLSSTLAVQRAA
jgi:MFS transporter, FHS family, glucose/mannose:H+ symporter